jgi:hypothetical protein
MSWLLQQLWQLAMLTEICLVTLRHGSAGPARMVAPRDTSRRPLTDDMDQVGRLFGNCTQAENEMMFLPYLRSLSRKKRTPLRY